jgi:RHS repeat-associated protein
VDEQGAYTLERRYSYEQAFHKVSEATDMAVYVDGALAGMETSQKFRYDEHGRLIKTIRTPDTDAFPSEVISYELGDPVSRISIKSRSKSTGEPDLYTVNCSDGKGQKFQSRVQIGPSNYQVSGFTVFNSQGQVVRDYQPYSATTDACDTSETTVPSGTLFKQYHYDASDRLVMVVNEDATQLRTIYEPLAIRHYAEDDNQPGNANFNTPTVKRMDGLGRTVAVDRYLTPTSKGTTSMAYDDLGRLRQVIDAAGNKRTQEYDGVDRPVRIIDPNSGEVTISYDAMSNPLEQKDPVRTRKFSYDGRNRQIASWDVADENGTKSTVTYDRIAGCAECTHGAGDVVQLRYPLGPDALGDAVGMDQLGYDARGRLIYRSQRLEGHAFVTRLDYDNADRMIKKTFPDGRTESSAFDRASRLSSIDGIISAVSYDARGQVTSVKHANGTEETKSYDLRQRVTSMRTLLGQAALIGIDFTRAVDGSLIAAIDKSDTALGRPGRGAKVTSDAWHRTLSTELSTGLGGAEVLSSTYDAIDNVLSITSSLGVSSAANVGNASYDAQHPNMLIQAGGLAYAYDAAGRMTARGDASFSRDWHGRLARVTRAGRPPEVSIFAAEGDRVIKLSEGGAAYYLDPSFEVRDGIGIAYTRAGGRIARSMSDAIAPQVLTDLAPATFVGGGMTPVGDKHITVADAWLAQAASVGLVTFTAPTTPSPVSRLLRASARRALLDDGEAVVHLHQDGLGSLVMATGATGQVLGERSFYPTGQERESAGFVDTYGFTGQELEAASGLLHFQHRDLDPLTGRWDAVDPAFAVLDDDNADTLGESMSGYAYVANDTANNIDPTGLNLFKRLGASLGRKLDRHGLRGAARQSAQKSRDIGKRRAKLKQAKIDAYLKATTNADGGGRGFGDRAAAVLKSADYRESFMAAVAEEPNRGGSNGLDELAFIEAVQRLESDPKLAAATDFTKFANTHLAVRPSAHGATPDGSRILLTNTGAEANDRRKQMHADVLTDSRFSVAEKVRTLSKLKSGLLDRIGGDHLMHWELSQQVYLQGSSGQRL